MVHHERCKKKGHNSDRPGLSCTRYKTDSGSTPQIQREERYHFHFDMYASIMFSSGLVKTTLPLSEKECKSVFAEPRRTESNFSTDINTGICLIRPILCSFYSCYTEKKANKSKKLENLQGFAGLYSMMSCCVFIGFRI